MAGEEAGAVLALAERIARAAGAIQRDRFETGVSISTKSSTIDLVTEVDHECEALIAKSVGDRRALFLRHLRYREQGRVFTEMRRIRGV